MITLSRSELPALKAAIANLCTFLVSDRHLIKQHQQCKSNVNQSSRGVVHSIAVTLSDEQKTLMLLPFPRAHGSYYQIVANLHAVLFTVHLRLKMKYCNELCTVLYIGLVATLRSVT